MSRHCCERADEKRARVAGGTVREDSSFNLATSPIITQEAVVESLSYVIFIQICTTVFGGILCTP
eukprot:4519806-Amphidinium_carterae.1